MYNGYEDFWDIVHADLACLTDLTFRCYYSSGFDGEALQVLSQGQWPLLESLHCTSTLVNSFNASETALTIAGMLRWPAAIDWQKSSVPKLHVFSLDSDFMHKSEFVGFRQCHFPNLRRLKLGNNRLSVHSVQEIVCGKWPLLAYLDVSGSVVVEGCLRLLQQAPWEYLARLAVSRREYSLALEMHLAQQWPGSRIDIKEWV